MMMELDTILCGDSLNVLKALPEGSVHCCVTSPPYYGLRDYGMDAQIGREATPEICQAKFCKKLRTAGGCGRLGMIGKPYPARIIGESTFKQIAG